MTDRVVKVEEVRGYIETTDGKVTEFSIGTDGRWQQWGDTTEVLGDRVDALEAMARALTEDSLIATSDDDDPVDMRAHLIVMHAEDDESLDGMMAELRDVDDERSPTFADATDGWLLDYIHQRQHESGDWNAGHDEDDETTSIDWSPLPGHHPGQDRAHIVYVEAEHKGMHCELYESLDGGWQWSFYDSNSPDPDVSVASDTEPTRDAAERALREYIDGHIQEV